MSQFLTTILFSINKSKINLYAKIMCKKPIFIYFLPISLWICHIPKVLQCNYQFQIETFKFTSVLKADPNN